METQSGSVSQTAISPRGEWHWAWGFVFLANLPVPLLFGLMLTSEGGVFGMLAGATVVWLAGHYVVTRFRFVRGVLVFGGAWIAISQVVPLLQIGAGLVAVTMVADRVNTLSREAAFAVTLLTAGQLVVVALMCGLATRATGLVVEGWICRRRY